MRKNMPAATRFEIDGEIILDCTDFLHNYSCISLARFNDNQKLVLPEILQQNDMLFEKINRDTDQIKYFGQFQLMTYSIAQYFIHHSGSIRIAEIGCEKGSLSAYIANMIAYFDSKADYVCVARSIGNESGSGWLDRIAQIDQVPERLSFLAAEYNHTPLADNYFHCTVINGTVPIPDPMGTIREASRITAESGRIFCISDNQFLLEDTFRLLFAERKVWQSNDNIEILIAENKNIWQYQQL